MFLHGFFAPGIENLGSMFIEYHQSPNLMLMHMMVSHAIS